MKTNAEMLLDSAVSGNKQALEELLKSVQGLVYNLSLRMLGNLHDAEDASQEIYIRIITGLSSFEKKSSFSTWVYRIATNHLLNYRKSFFANRPLSFEFYQADIDAGFVGNSNDTTEQVDNKLLAYELKMSCTNVMLQCFDPESRLIYILGIMFKVDSKVCGEILDITPDAYRQRLSRIRKRMSDFLRVYCGLSSGKCNCEKRINYAIKNKRLNPDNLEYSSLGRSDEDFSQKYIDAMEALDDEAQVFASLPKYSVPQTVKEFILKLLQSDNIKTIQKEAR